MLADSPGNRRNIRIVIALLQLYGPVCLGYTIWAVLATIWPDLDFGYNGLLNNPIALFLCVSEAAFYVFFLWYARYIQAAAIHPPLRTRDERLRLFDKVRAEIHDFESFLRGWFSGAKPGGIGLDELRKWIDWAFWEGRAGEAKEQGEEAEIDGYVQKIEQLVGKPFQDGPGQAKALRLTLDPIAIEPRSLAWYCLIMFADTLAIFVMKIKGFSYYRRTMPGLAAVFPPRPAALCTRKVSPAPSLSYFLRKHTSKTRLPVIYLHGIGIGILPHIEFLDEMQSALNADASPNDQVGILAIEILQISSRLTAPIPRSANFVSQLTTLINHHFGSSRVVLVSHSYGTILSTPIMKDPQLSSRISGTLLIDPVSILLHMPDVAYNFTIRKPVRVPEWEMWWFGSRDPQVAHTLGRHLFWSECVLWRDRIEHLIKDHNMQFTASLASEDIIVNTRAVRDYLMRGERPAPVIVHDVAGEEYMDLKTQGDGFPDMGKWRGVGLEVLWWNGYNHAGVFQSRRDRAKLVHVVVEYCSGE